MSSHQDEEINLVIIVVVIIIVVIVQKLNMKYDGYIFDIVCM